MYIFLMISVELPTGSIVDRTHQLAFRRSTSLLRFILPSIRQSEKMDYKGQLLAETLYFYIIVFFGAAGWIVGFVMGDFTYTVKGWAAGVVLSLILVVPDWPMFNRHPTKWLDQLPPRAGVMPVGAAADEDED